MYTYIHFSANRRIMVYFLCNPRWIRVVRKQRFRLISYYSFRLLYFFFFFGYFCRGIIIRISTHPYGGGAHRVCEFDNLTLKLHSYVQSVFLIYPCNTTTETPCCSVQHNIMLYNNNICTCVHRCASNGFHVYKMCTVHSSYI